MAEKPGELNKETSLSINDDNDDAIEKVYLMDENAEKSDTSDDPAQIRANIEETRAEMSETIDAIQEKLSYEKISEQVKEEVSEYVSETYQTVKNTVFETVLKKAGEIMNYIEKGVNELSDSKAMKTARRYPIALTLIGVGVGILLVKGKKKKTTNYRHDKHDDGENRSYRRKSLSDTSHSVLKTAQDKMSGAVDTVTGTASAVSGAISSAAGTVSDTVSNVAGKAYDQVGNIGSYATDAAETAQDKFEYYMEEKPLVVGAAALALGAAVGLSIPSTKVENRLMGEARQNLMDMAEESARGAVGKVKEAASQMSETVKEEARNQGLK